MRHLMEENVRRALHLRKILLVRGHSPQIAFHLIQCQVIEKQWAKHNLGAVLTQSIGTDLLASLLGRAGCVSGVGQVDTGYFDALPEDPIEDRPGVPVSDVVNDGWRVLY